MNAVDPDGEDLIYIVDKYAVGGDPQTKEVGKGHSAMITGPVNGDWRYDSFGKQHQGHRHGTYIFDTAEQAFDFAQSEGYTDAQLWKTSPAQTAAAQQEMDKWHSGNGDNYETNKTYKFLGGDNCQEMVDAAFKAAEVPNYKDYLQGNPNYDFKQNANLSDGSGTLQMVEDMVDKHEIGIYAP